jgi:hypothetical protein
MHATGDGEMSRWSGRGDVLWMRKFGSFDGQEKFLDGAGASTANSTPAESRRGFREEPSPGPARASSGDAIGHVP